MVGASHLTNLTKMSILSGEMLMADAVDYNAINMEVYVAMLISTTIIYIDFTLEAAHEAVCSMEPIWIRNGAGSSGR